MKISSLLSAGGLFALTVASTASALPANPLTPPQHAVSCTKPRPIPNYNGTDFRNVGVLLFPGFDLIDVFGTIEPLQSLSLSTQQINLSMIARTLDPVSRGPDHPGIEKYRSAFSPAALPTHTFDDELDLDLLIVPGGNGVRKPDMPDEIAYIKRMFPRVKVLMTICTGSGLAARAGIMDGYMATTNKAAWQSILPMGPRVKWVSPARYVIDGKLWTSSGVTSALDLIFKFVDMYWGHEVSDKIAGGVEHVPREANDDPFSLRYRIPPTLAQPCKPKLG